MRYIEGVAIQSFSDRAAERFFIKGRLGSGVGWAAIRRIVRRKLDMLHYAHELKDLGSPPGNRLVALKGGMKGWHSIRINDQWRVVFRWDDQGPPEVRVTDYH